MSLTSDQVSTIKRLGAGQFSTSARVCLFGALVRDDACGRGVDLMVEVGTATEDPAPKGGAGGRMEKYSLTFHNRYSRSPAARSAHERRKARVKNRARELGISVPIS